MRILVTMGIWDMGYGDGAGFCPHSFHHDHSIPVFGCATNTAGKQDGIVYGCAKGFVFGRQWFGVDPKR